MGKVLAIRGGALGDFVLTLPALRLISEGLPSAEVEVLGYRPMVELAERAGVARRTRAMEHAGLAPFFAPGARLDPEWADWFSGFSVVFTWLYDPDDYFKMNLARCGVETVFQGIPRVEDSEGSPHACLQLAEVCQGLALWLEDPVPRIPFVRERCAGVAVHPGSGSMRKNWPREHWREFVVELCGLLPEGERVAVFSGEAEESWIDGLLEGWGSLPVDHVRHPALGDLAASLAGSRLFVGHDSGVTHLAAACGVPTVTLFGPTNPGVWAPPQEHVKVLRGAKGDLTKLPLAEVLAAVRRMLTGS